MMNKTLLRILTYILTFIFLVAFGCNEQTQENNQKDTKTETDDNIQVLTKLSGKWIQDSSIFWTSTEGGTWKEIPPIDTANYMNYTIRETYRLELKNDLSIKKVIDIAPKSKNKISETDIYIRQVNPNIESRLGINYNFKTKNYYADYLDSTGTKGKIKTNRAKADSILKTADKEGLYLCGTAYNEILWEDIPFLPIPREISKDSALVIINEWTNK